MKFTPLITVLGAAILLAGCQATSSPATYQGNNSSTNNAQACGFSKLPGNEYRIAPEYRQFITNDFFYDPDVAEVYQLDKSKFSPLTSQSFKVLETGVVTAEDRQSRQAYLSPYRYNEVEIDGTPYMLDKSFSTKLVTEDCSIFYLGGSMLPKSLTSHIQMANGEPITSEDLLVLIGTEPLAKREMAAEVTFDEFDRLYRIRTPAHDGMILRGAYKPETDDLMLVQLYTNLLFFKDWGNISRAVDDTGTTREITRIDTDIDCSSSSLVGCRLTETVGVTLSEQFLMDNQDGFRVKFSGTREKVVEVKPFMIQGFLAGVKEAKAKQ